MGLARDWRLPALALVPFVVLAILRSGDGYGAEAGDHAQYLLHARALSEGKPYTETGYLYSALNPQIGPAAYPPGLPATLVPLVATGNAATAVGHVVMLLLAALYLLLAGAYFRELDGPRMGALVVLLAGLSVVFIHVATKIVTDAAFCAFVWGALLLADRKGAWTARRIAAISILGCAAIGYRFAGIALVPAAVAFGVVQFRRLRYAPFLPAAVWSVFAVVLSLSLPSVGGYAAQMPGNAAGVAATVFRGMWDGRNAVADATFLPFPWHDANLVWHLVASVLILVGLIRWARGHGRTLLFWFAGAYTAEFLLYPHHLARYLWPLFPLLIYALFLGLESACGLSRHLAPRRRAIAAGLATVLVVVQTVRVSAAPPVRDMRETDDVVALFHYLEDAPGRPERRVSFVKPRVLALETGIASIALLLGPPEACLDELRARRITEVVVGDLGEAPLGTAALRAAIATHPEAFELVWHNDSFEVFHFRG